MDYYHSHRRNRLSRSHFWVLSSAEHVTDPPNRIKQTWVVTFRRSDPPSREAGNCMSQVMRDGITRLTPRLPRLQTKGDILHTPIRFFADPYWRGPKHSPGAIFTMALVGDDRTWRVRAGRVINCYRKCQDLSRRRGTGFGRTGPHVLVSEHGPAPLWVI